MTDGLAVMATTSSAKELEYKPRHTGKVTPPGCIAYHVDNSDTLAKIALKCNSTPSELSRLNRLSCQLLFPGQTLFVPGAVPPEDVEQIQLRKYDADAITTEPSHVDHPTERAFSPDHQIEALLRRESLHTEGDEISAEYLKIDSKFITDGQGVVPGVLLVTPQTVMFNPSVSDHLVIERGREAYLIRTPMKAIHRVSFYKDIAAMVLGEAESRISPLDFGVATSIDSSVANGAPDDAATTPGELQCADDNSRHEDSSTLELTIDQDSTGDSCPLGETTTLPDVESSWPSAKRTSAEKRPQTRTKMTSSPLRMLDPSMLLEDCIMNDDSIERCHGKATNSIADSSCDTFDETVESPVHSKPRMLTSPTDQENRHIDPRRPHLKLLHEDEHELRDMSKDSGFSGSDFSSASLLRNNGKRQKDITMPPLTSSSHQLIRTSSLSEEARMWLGKHGVRLPSESETSDTSPAELEELTVPRPAKPVNDQLIYVALKVRKSYWSPHDQRRNSIMGLPPNRDQKRRENWFAVPKCRIDQFYSFLLTSCPQLDDDDASLSQDEASDKEEGISFIENNYSSSPAHGFILENGKGRTSSIKSRSSGSEVYPGKAVLLRSSVEDDLPDMVGECQLLTKRQISLLSKHLPSRTVGHSWTLAYSTAVHGISLRTLYRNMEDLDSPVLLFIRDEAKRIFGAFMSNPPAVSDGFYGTGESMLFTFKSEADLKVYRWSGENYFFIKGDPRCLTIGGGDGQVGLWLDEDLFHGRSHSCKTFDNDTLSVTEDFICSALEAWSFV